MSLRVLYIRMLPPSPPVHQEASAGSLNLSTYLQWQVSHKTFGDALLEVQRLGVDNLLQVQSSKTRHGQLDPRKMV